MLIDQELLAQIQFDRDGKLKSVNTGKKEGEQVPEPQMSVYQPDPETKRVTQIVTDSFRWADVTKRKPRREFNDLSELSRMMVDQMAFNIYQPNNGQAYAGDVIDSWKSNAMRPVARNKVMSVVAHVTAKILYPKVFAYNEQSEIQEDAAIAMRDLIEWASDQNDYARMAFFTAINACVNPYAVVHAEYAEAYKLVKTEQNDDGSWKAEEILDEDSSGFKLTPVPCDEFFYGDFYTEDVQKQPYIIWRRVQTFSAMQSKYGHCKNFQYVKPGMQIVYNDANVSFYEVYDSNLRGSLCEEVLFWCKSLDLYLPLVNGVMMTQPDNPNPRLDKQYPFAVTGYEPFDEGRSICKKALVFKMQPEADIIDTLYQLIIDGTYLNIMPPIIISGEEMVASDIIIPGVSTVLTDSDSKITPLRVGQDVRQGLEIVQKLEADLSESSIQPLPTGKITAFQLSRIQQEQGMLLQPFIYMISSLVRQYGKLLVSDILQHMTIPEVNDIIDDGELIYKTFIVHDRHANEGKKTRTIKFDLNMPKEVTDDEAMDHSYKILEEQGGHDSKNEIYKANPQFFRKLKYMCTVSPDTMTPMSDELEKAFGLELFDRAIKGPSLGVPIDMEQVFKDFLFKLYPKSSQDVDKYFSKDAQQPPQIPGQPPIPGMNPNPMQPGQPPAPGQQPAVPASPNKSPMTSMQNSILTPPKP